MEVEGGAFPLGAVTARGLARGDAVGRETTRYGAGVPGLDAQAELARMRLDVAS